jgi:acylphosphatase
MPQQAAARVVVRGRVQGVFFRAATRETAELLRLCGWVRNRSDGSVEAWLEGERGAIEQMIAWCRRGPDMAHVEGLEHSWEEPTGCAGFRITG